MTREELNTELQRLDCGHRWCGPHGFIFHPENTGGVNIEGLNLHFWGCCANVCVDIGTALDMLRALPDGIGHKKICDAFRELAGVPENPHCLYRNGPVAGVALEAKRKPMTGEGASPTLGADSTLGTR